MASKSAQTFLACLAALCFVLRSFGAVAPAGLALCIGCDEGGVRIGVLCSVELESSKCCHDESDGCTEPDDAPSPCSCIDVAIGDVTSIVATPVTIDWPQDFGVLALDFGATALVELQGSDADLQVAVWPRAGPEAPLRLLAPRSRCTIFVV